MTAHRVALPHDTVSVPRRPGLVKNIPRDDQGGLVEGKISSPLSSALADLASKESGAAQRWARCRDMSKLVTLLTAVQGSSSRHRGAKQTGGRGVARSAPSLYQTQRGRDRRRKAMRWPEVDD